MRERGPSGRWRIRIRWGVLFVLMGVLGVCGYLAFSTAMYFYFLKIQKFEDVQFVDMLTLLANREEHRAKVGDYQIEKAKEAIGIGEWREALQYLQTGVARSPQNLEGRMLLADFFMYAIRDPERARLILSEGVEYAHDNTDYLRKYYGVLLAFHKDEEVIEVAETILPKTNDPEVQRVLAIGAASSAYYRGRFDQAEDYLRKYDLLDGDLQGTLLAARINWERGDKESAIARLQSAMSNYRELDPVYELLSRFYREEGDFAKARQYTVLRSVSAPLNVAPRIDLLKILQQTGDTERAQSEARAILNQFSNDENALTLLANYATDHGDTDLNAQIYDIALNNNFNIAPYTLLLIESYVVAEDYQKAIEMTAQLVEERPAWLDNSWAIFNSLRSVAYYGLGNSEMGKLYLDQYLKSEQIRVDSLLAVSNRFIKMGNKKEARDILKRAYTANPENQAALTSLIDLEIDLGNSTEIGPYLKELLQMRRPAKQILHRAYTKLGSDRFIFTPDREKLLAQLEDMIQPGSVKQAGNTEDEQG